MPGKKIREKIWEREYLTDIIWKTQHNVKIYERIWMRENWYRICHMKSEEQFGRGANEGLTMVAHRDKTLPRIWEVFCIMGCVFGFWKVFWILRSVLYSWKCFWILGSVLESGKFFWILGSILSPWVAVPNNSDKYVLGSRHVPCEQSLFRIERGSARRVTNMRTMNRWIHVLFVTNYKIADIHTLTNMLTEQDW